MTFSEFVRRTRPTLYAALGFLALSCCSYYAMRQYHPADWVLVSTPLHFEQGYVGEARFTVSRKEQLQISIVTDALLYPENSFNPDDVVVAYRLRLGSVTVLQGQVPPYPGGMTGAGKSYRFLSEFHAIPGEEYAVQAKVIAVRAVLRTGAPTLTVGADPRDSASADGFGMLVGVAALAAMMCIAVAIVKARRTERGGRGQL